MSLPDVDLIAVPIVTLLELAKAHGVRVYLTDAIRGAIIRPHRDSTMRPLVDALRNRREELSQYIVAHRPPMAAISDDEMRFRRDVLREPNDVLLDGLTFGELRAIVTACVQDALAAERTAQEWERRSAGRDDSAEALHRKRQHVRRAASADRTVF